MKLWKRVSHGSRVSSSVVFRTFSYLNCALDLHYCLLTADWVVLIYARFAEYPVSIHV